MRIGFTLEQCWHEVPGGTATSALRLADALVAAGERVVGVAARHSGMPRAPYVPTVPMGFLGLPRPLLYVAWNRLGWPRVEKAIGPVDVVHATGMACPPRTVPLVVTLHDLAWRRYPAHASAHGNRFFEASLRAAKRRADAFVCPSAATADDAGGAGVPGERLRVIPHGVDLTLATPPEIESFRTRHGIDYPYLLWTGTIEPRKNLRVLLEAFALLIADPQTDPRLRLVLAGPSGWNENLDTRVQAMAGRVVQLGFVPSAEMASLYAAAECFCFPSLLEGFGLPVLEAMAQGTPVVISDAPALVEVAGPTAPAVPPTDPQGLAAALASVLHDDAERGRLGRQARERAQEFSWERSAQAHRTLYADLVG